MANTGIEMSRQMLSTSQVLTLDWQIASLFQTLERQVHPEPCRGAGHQRERRHAELPRLRQRREPVHVRDHARDAAPPDAGEVLAERRGAALVQREHERRNGVGRGELRRDVVPDGHDVVVRRSFPRSNARVSVCMTVIARPLACRTAARWSMALMWPGKGAGRGVRGGGGGCGGRPSAPWRNSD
jgi:hypothetical protein